MNAADRGRSHGRPKAHPHTVTVTNGDVRAFGKSLIASPALFVSQAALTKGVAKKWGLSRPMLAVKGTRKIGKKDMIHNTLCPEIEVDPETYEVRANGELLTCEPATVLPMAQRYFLF